MAGVGTGPLWDFDAGQGPVVGLQHWIHGHGMWDMSLYSTATETKEIIMCVFQTV